MGKLFISHAAKTKPEIRIQKCDGKAYLLPFLRRDLYFGSN